MPYMVCHLPSTKTPVLDPHIYLPYDWIMGMILRISQTIQYQHGERAGNSLPPQKMEILLETSTTNNYIMYIYIFNYSGLSSAMLDYRRVHLIIHITMFSNRWYKDVSRFMRIVRYVGKQAQKVQIPACGCSKATCLRLPRTASTSSQAKLRSI